MSASDMDARLRQQQIEGVRISAAAYADIIQDPKVQQQMRESAAQLQWEKDHTWMPVPDICDLVQRAVPSDEEIRRLETLGLKGMGLRIIPGRFNQKDNAQLVLHRETFTQWLAVFDAAALSLGYARPAPSTGGTTTARLAGVGAVAALMAFGLLG